MHRVKRAGHLSLKREIDKGDSQIERKEYSTQHQSDSLKQETPAQGKIGSTKNLAYVHRLYAYRYQCKEEIDKVNKGDCDDYERNTYPQVSGFF